MGWGLVGVALMWLMVAVSALSVTAAILVLGRKGWSRGLVPLMAMLIAVALVAMLRLLAGPEQSWNAQLLGCVLFSLALNALVVALHQFRQVDLDWRWLALPPATIFLLGNTPLLGGDHVIALLHAIAAVFMVQVVWAALQLWHMRQLQLGLGYRMVCASVVVFLVGLPFFQCGWELGLSLSTGATQMLRYGLRGLLMVAALLLLSLGFMRMVQDRREARSRHAALRDPLTRMLNRRALVRTLEHCIQNTARQELPMALLLVDVDHFKRVNDTYGHISGDKVLRHVSRVLASHVRADSFVGRFGGEEFVIVCPGTAMDEASILAERLNLAVRSASVRIKGHTLHVTVSIGGFSGLVPANTPWESLLEAADGAMYRAKDAGRDRVIMQRDLPHMPALSQSSYWKASHA
ncbi:MAG: GGDEF domain-containing protein [Comamonas sp.]